MPLELRERVFEKFFRIPGREPRDPRRVGIGLGLPIARRLVEAQGGRIALETPESGRGTAVALMLPVAAVDAADAADGGGARELEEITWRPGSDHDGCARLNGPRSKPSRFEFLRIANIGSPQIGDA